MKKSQSLFRPFVLMAFLMILITGSACADAIDANQAREMVGAWLASDDRPLTADLARQVKGSDTYLDEGGNPDYYIVNLEPDGFVIVSGDDLAEPVVGFVSGGTYEESPCNPLTALLNSDVRGRARDAREAVKAARREGKPFLPSGRYREAKQKWDRFLNVQSTVAVTSSIPGVSDIRVPALVETRWDQRNVAGNAVYNYYTPPGSEGSTGNYYCGCLATAYAQLMRYFRYPTAGVGSQSYYYSVSGTLQPQTMALRGGDGAGGPYKWEDMVAVPNSSTTLAQRKAIGALCLDAGLASSAGLGSAKAIDYTSGGTGAYMTAYELTYAFKYSNAIFGYSNGNNIGSGLVGMINPNLDAGYPVLLGITTASNAGHAIIADGYGYDSSTLYHHLNLGWSGDSSAWYNLPDITTPYYAFNCVDTCIYNIYTSGSGEIISGRVTDSAGNPISGATVTAKRSASTFGPVTTGSNGIYAIPKIPSGKTYTVTVVCSGYTFSSQSVLLGTSMASRSTSGNRWGINFTGQGGPSVTNFAIDGGNTVAASQNVTLNNICSGTPTHYMASESASFTGASWQPYSTAPSFTLSYGGGIKTVYFKVKNSIGTESAVVSDAINAESVPPISTSNPSGGVFRAPLTLLLSANEPAVIYYTTDGTTPTTSSNVYSGLIPISADTTVKFFAVDTIGNVESAINEVVFYYLAEDGSIASAKNLSDGSPVRLGGKALYYQQPGFGYIEEPNRFSGIRVQGSIFDEPGYCVRVVGNIVKSAGTEPYIDILMMESDGAGSVNPLGANNRSLDTALMEGLRVTVWGVVKPDSVTADSYVISDGSPGEGIKIITPYSPSVSEGQFVSVTGAAGFADGRRVVYSD